MSKRYMIFVIDTLANTGTSDEMLAIDAFNDQLQANNQWIVAGGLAAPSSARVIDNRLGVGIDTGKPLFAQAEQFSGFWLIQAESDEVAQRLAFEGSKACNRKVELRPLL